jgi:hypothetical protein
MTEIFIYKQYNRFLNELWLGDAKKINEIVEQLKRQQEQLVEYLKAYEEVSNALREVEQTIKEYENLEDYQKKLKMMELLEEKIRDKGKISKALVGYIINFLSKNGNLEKFREVLEGDGYRYSVIENILEYEYEIRVLVDDDRRVNLENLEQLKENLSKRDINVVFLKTDEEKSYAYLKIFSNEFYGKILILPPRILINLSFGNEAKDQAESLSKEILQEIIKKIEIK